MEANNPSYQYCMVDKVVNRWVSEGFWEGGVFYDYLENNLKMYPNNEALVDSRWRLTFSDLDRIVNNLASNLIEMGIKKHDVIGAQVPNRVEYFFMRYALSKIGGVIMSIGVGLRRKELKYLLEVTEAKGLLTPAFFHGFDHAKMMEDVRMELPHLKHVFLMNSSEKKLHPGVYFFEEMLKDRPVHDKIKDREYKKLQKGPMEIDMLNLTSGTTGMPKICQCIPNARMCFGKQIAIRCGITSEDIMLVICPMTGGIGNSCSTLAAGYAGCKVVLLERFSADDALKLIEKEKATIIVGVPAQFIKMLSSDLDRYRLDSLRLIISAGSYFPVEKAKETVAKMNAKLVSVFGSHDGGTITVGTPDLDEEDMFTTVGAPLPYTDIKILDPEGKEVPRGEVGEIVVRSPNGCIGYLGDIDGTHAVWDSERYFYSGDLVRMTEKGLLESRGRSKDIIIRGGQNINPEEIEDILVQHPDVENCAMIGMPDPILGERNCLYVVPMEGKVCTLQKIVSFLKEKEVATFKLPERLEVIDELPLSEGRKPARKVLRRDIEAKLKKENP